MRDYSELLDKSVKRLSELIISGIERELDVSLTEIGDLIGSGELWKAKEAVSNLSIRLDDVQLLLAMETMFDSMFLDGSGIVSKKKKSIVSLVGVRQGLSKKDTAKAVILYAAVFIYVKKLIADWIDHYQESLEKGAQINRKSLAARFFSTIRSFITTGVDIISEMFSQKSLVSGMSSERVASGTMEYVIKEVMDAGTCPVCRMMHGKKFEFASVSKLAKQMDQASSPDDWKNLKPWPSRSKASLERLGRMSVAELADANLNIPPYHPRCRGSIDGLSGGDYSLKHTIGMAKMAMNPLRTASDMDTYEMQVVAMSIIENHLDKGSRSIAISSYNEGNYMRVIGMVLGGK